MPRKWAAPWPPTARERPGLGGGAVVASAPKPATPAAPGQQRDSAWVSPVDGSKAERRAVAVVDATDKRPRAGKERHCPGRTAGPSLTARAPVAIHPGQSSRMIRMAVSCGPASSLPNGRTIEGVAVGGAAARNAAVAAAPAELSREWPASRLHGALPRPGGETPLGSIETTQVASGSWPCPPLPPF
ncbi:hypothetical protein CDD83_3488 [Cordyceps sp. RAO-2017]|nr:hypothetical protein CDD83_3488 [Cordyceps sp. RAO-2017]